jgi:dihydroorotate dehydrogenase
VQRPAYLRSPFRTETGGLSGRPLKLRANEAVRTMFRLTGGRVPIVGVGGIESGQDAYDRIRAGASLVQLYSALAYDGPALAVDIKRDLAARLRRDGFSSVRQAVGVDAAKDPSAN